MVAAEGGQLDSLREGTLIAQRYRLERRVGAGGMGVVFEATDEITGRRRAVKVMRPRLAHEEDLQRRFAMEARVTGGLRSRHLVEVLDAGVDVELGLPYLAMELLSGEDLGARLARCGPMSVEQALSMLEPLAMTLDAMHAQGVIHRDLKPENLFLAAEPDGSETLKILDFGAAKIVAERSFRTTRTLGSPLYVSPEALEGDGTIDGRADVYALGHLAFTLLVGRAYWEEEWCSSGAVYPALARVMRGARESASARATRRGAVLPAGFDPWFETATARSPSNRFETAGEAVALLRRALAGSWRGRKTRVPIVAALACGVVASFAFAASDEPDAQPAERIAPSKGLDSVAAHATDPPPALALRAQETAPVVPSSSASEARAGAADQARAARVGRKAPLPRASAPQPKVPPPQSSASAQPAAPRDPAEIR